MAELQTIARPYAEAAFKVARDAGGLQAWSEALGRLSTVVGTDVARRLIGSPSVTPAQVVGTLTDVAGGLDEAQKRFVQVLTDNERLSVLPEIATLFDELRNSHEGVLEAHVSSAFPLANSQVDEIVKILSERYGKRVKAEVHHDPALIGGVSIRVGDEVIDASVRGKLAQMAGALKQP